MNKKRIKTLKWAIAPVSLTPLMTMIGASCSHRDKYDDLAEPIQKDVLDYFEWICNYSRPTFHTKAFCEQLEAKIKEILGSEQKVVRGTGYKPIDPKTHEEYPDHGWNLYTDIESSVDGQDRPSVIIQCHTDMVWVTKEGIMYDHPKMVNDLNERGKPIIHTKNYETSLGADNGMGVATALALMKNKDTFTHGKIRFLFTTDEEDGESGAKYVDEAWLYEDENKQKQFDYLLNIDLEQIYNEAVSCGGVQQAYWSKEFDYISQEEVDQEAGWEIQISGLKGGHSGKDIDLNRINAIKLGFDLLGAISECKENENTQLFYCSERWQEETKPNAIPTDLSISFACDFLRSDDGRKKILSIINPVIEEYKEQHPEETELTVNLFSWVEQREKNDGEPRAGLSNDDTKKVINFVKALPHGVESVFDDGQVKDSCNLAAIRFNDFKYSIKDYPQTGKIKLYVEMFGRSPILEDLGKEPDPQDPTQWGGYMQKFRGISNEIFADEIDKTNWNPKGWNPPWEPQIENKIRETVWEASQTFGYEMHKSNRIGWLEVAEFAQKSKGLMDLVAIGPTITEVHTVNETIEVDTIIPMLKMVLYTLEKVPERRA